MGRPRLYATSVERQAAWRRRQGMAVRPHYPSAAAKQAAYRARKLAAQVLAARACAAIQQALQTRARADQSWELHALIDDWSRDADMPQRVADGPPSGLVAGANASFYGRAAARVRQHRRTLRRLAHIKATKGAHADALSAASADRAQGSAPLPSDEDGGERR